MADKTSYEYSRFRGNRHYWEILAAKHRREAIKRYYERKHQNIELISRPKYDTDNIENWEERNAIPETDFSGQVPDFIHEKEHEELLQVPSYRWFLTELAKSPYYALRWAYTHGKTYWIPYALGFLYLYGKGIDLAR